MISQYVRAIYSEGQLRLLDSVELSEGQEIRLVILSEQDGLRAALSDLLAYIPAPNNEDIDEASLIREIEEGFRGQPPLSDTIIAERREGP